MLASNLACGRKMLISRRTGYWGRDLIVGESRGEASTGSRVNGFAEGEAPCPLLQPPGPRPLSPYLGPHPRILTRRQTALFATHGRMRNIKIHCLQTWKNYVCYSGVGFTPLWQKLLLLDKWMNDVFHLFIHLFTISTMANCVLYYSNFLHSDFIRLAGENVLQYHSINW